MCQILERGKFKWTTSMGGGGRQHGGLCLDEHGTAGELTPDDVSNMVSVLSRHLVRCFDGGQEVRGEDESAARTFPAEAWTNSTRCRFKASVLPMSRRSFTPRSSARPLQISRVEFARTKKDMQTYASCPGSGQSCCRHECPLGMKTYGPKSLNALIAFREFFKDTQL